MYRPHCSTLLNKFRHKLKKKVYEFFTDRNNGMDRNFVELFNYLILECIH